MSYLEWCGSCVAGQGTRNGHSMWTSDDSGVKGVDCDQCFMGGAVEVDAMNERCLFFHVGS